MTKVAPETHHPKAPIPSDNEGCREPDKAIHGRRRGRPTFQNLIGGDFLEIYGAIYSNKRKKKVLEIEK
jgi:hypothetical protein